MAPVFTTNTPTAWHPDVTLVPASEAIPNSLAMTISTVGAKVEGDNQFVRIPVVTDDAATVVPEGSEIPLAAPELSERVVATVKVAKLLRISNEQSRHQNAPEMLASAAGRSIVTKCDDLLLNSPKPTDGQPGFVGLLNTVGLVKGADISGSLDALVDLVATIQTNGGDPSHIVASPSAWASLRKMKTGADTAVSMLGAGQFDAAPVLLGLPVVVSNAMPADKIFVVDATDCVSAVGDLAVAQSSDAYFTSDSLAIRSTIRVGAVLVHPDRHGIARVVAPVAGA